MSFYCKQIDQRDLYFQAIRHLSIFNSDVSLSFELPLCISL